MVVTWIFIKMEKASSLSSLELLEIETKVSNIGVVDIKGCVKHGSFCCFKSMIKYILCLISSVNPILLLNSIKPFYNFIEKSSKL